MKKHYQVGGKGGYVPLPKSQEENRMELSVMSKVSHLSSGCPYNPDARYLLRNTFCTPAVWRGHRDLPQLQLNACLSHLLLLLTLMLTEAAK